MSYKQNSCRAANFATKAYFLGSGGREVTIERVSFVQFCDAFQDKKRSDGQNQGQNSSCMRCAVVKRNYLSVNFTRKLSTSCRHCTVTIDKKKNYYHVLGVTPNCSSIKIKQAYYRLSKVYHPDVNKSKAAIAKFHELSEAYEILSNPSLKHAYDSGRHVHSHSLHRGTVKPHPVNFRARGPHQHVNTDKYNYDNWMKAHYSESVKKSAKIIKEKKMRQEFEEHSKAWATEKINYEERLETRLSGSEYAFLTFCGGMLITLAYFILKNKK